MFCIRKINALSLMLLTATTMWGMGSMNPALGTDRDLTFNTDRRDGRGGVEIDSSTGLAVMGYLAGGAVVAWAADKCMVPNDTSAIYNWTKNSLATPHDIKAIAKISTTSLSLAAICAPEAAKQFREFGIRAPIAGAVYALSRSKFAQELYGYVPFFGEALKAPTAELKKQYPLAGDMTSGVVAIATYKALDPVISALCRRAYTWWHGMYNESADTKVDSSDYKRVL
jgi:hypothetical protein